jgi:hypothetical protein
MEFALAVIPLPFCHLPFQPFLSSKEKLQDFHEIKDKDAEFRSPTCPVESTISLILLSSFPCFFLN